MPDIGSYKQLFLGPWVGGRDDHLVESMQNVTMQMHQAVPTGERLLEYDKAWESNGNVDVFQYPMGCVVKDGGLFRMYYTAFPKYPWNAHFTCYAESADGITWAKPNQGLFTWGGSTANNILLPNDSLAYRATDLLGATVFSDPNAGDYKAIALVDYDDEAFAQIAAQYGNSGLPNAPRGQVTFSSADGLDWSQLSSGPVNPGWDDTQFSAFWDERINKYVIYTRTKRRVPGSSTYYKQYQATNFDVQNEAAFRDHVRKDNRTNLGSVIYERRGGRAESADFISFGKEAEVIAPDTADHLTAPVNCPSQMDFHGPNVVKYSEAPDTYIALPDAILHNSFDWFTDYAVKYWEGPRYLPMTVTPLLMTSRDGISWNRTPQRSPFIRLGNAGSFWSKQVYARNVIRVGDELWIYFVGLEVARNLDQERGIQDVLGRSSPHKGAWSRAIMRLDGFISADAPALSVGEIVTKPLTFTGSELHLNAAVTGLGSVKVEIRDAANKPITGFAQADCDIYNGDSVDATVSWKGSKDVSSLVGQTVKLRFVMTNAKLYAFQFVA